MTLLGSTLTNTAPFQTARAVTLPPSAARVRALLAEHGPLTASAIAARAALPERTVRFAVSKLRAAGLVRVRASLRDARTNLIAVS